MLIPLYNFYSYTLFKLGIMGAIYRLNLIFQHKNGYAFYVSAGFSFRNSVFGICVSILITMLFLNTVSFPI